MVEVTKVELGNKERQKGRGETRRSQVTDHLSMSLRKC